MSDATTIFWSLIHAVGPTLTADDVRTLGASADWLANAGVLVETQAASAIECPNCADGHIEEVISMPDDPERLWVLCPLSRVQISPNDLRRWTFRIDLLAAALAKAFSLEGKPRVVCVGRIWSLGTTRLEQTKRELVLVIGDDASARVPLAQHVGAAGRSIVITTGQPPPRDMWPGRVPTCLPVRDVVAVAGAGFTPDVVLMLDLVRAGDAAAHHVGGLTLDEDQLDSIIRRKVRSVQRREVTEDIMLSAFSTHGTARKAATALKAEGYEVHHSTISRAMKDVDNKARVIRQDDSGSVARTVASQPRDRAKKFQERR